ncbi:MAG TPA: DUF2231 domain-containing protein [Nannocystaceae bacterium]|nr:DUF2231 domain-containing protein [Nannocystaceae bacterium]
MRAKATLLGHPVHQILIVLPLGLYMCAVVFDVVTMFRPVAELSIAAFWNIVVGTIGGLLAAVFGLIDWLSIPKGTRAKRVGIFHALTMVSVVALFTISAFLRFDRDDYFVTTAALVLELAGFALAGLGGWLGGELVDRLGVGVHEGANVDAPSSLSGRPATATTTATTPGHVPPSRTASSY